MSYLRTFSNNEYSRKYNSRKIRKNVFSRIIRFYHCFWISFDQKFQYILYSCFFLFLLIFDIFKVDFKEITLEINSDRFITLDDTIEIFILYPNIFWEFLQNFVFTIHLFMFISVSNFSRIWPKCAKLVEINLQTLRPLNLTNTTFLSRVYCFRL